MSDQNFTIYSGNSFVVHTFNIRFNPDDKLLEEVKVTDNAADTLFQKLSLEGKDVMLYKYVNDGNIIDIFNKCQEQKVTDLIVVFVTDEFFSFIRSYLSQQGINRIVWFKSSIGGKTVETAVSIYDSKFYNSDFQTG